MPMNTSAQSAPQPKTDDVSLIAGSVLPIKRAEELLASMPGVISARIVPADSGAIAEVHVLATAEVSGKQMVRNVESALIAHLGLRVDHRKISIATTVADSAGALEARAVKKPAAPSADTDFARRHVYFEDIEIRRSRTKGVSCRVTLRKGNTTFEGEAEGPEVQRLRADLAARATIAAIEHCEGRDVGLALEGAKLVDAFDRQFVFVGVTTKVGRDATMLTGSCEIKDSPETAAVLAVLDATNRVVSRGR
jgi:hypothetical protein